MQHLIILGLVLTPLTPILTSYLKRFWDKNPMWSNIAPMSYAVIAWMVDALVIGTVPWSGEGRVILITALGAVATGKWGRDALKYLKAA